MGSSVSGASCRSGQEADGISNTLSEPSEPLINLTCNVKVVWSLTESCSKNQNSGKSALLPTSSRKILVFGTAFYTATACGHRMAHRKWKETKQQPSMLPGPAMPGCSLVSFHFLWDILCPQVVQGGWGGWPAGNGKN